MRKHPALADQFERLRAQGFSLRDLSQRFHCSRAVARAICEQQWDIPAVQEYLRQYVLRKDLMRPAPERTSKPPTRLVPTRVGFDDQYVRAGWHPRFGWKE